MKILIKDNGEDWQELFIDGNRVFEAHKISVKDLIENINEHLVGDYISFDYEVDKSI